MAKFSKQNEEVNRQWAEIEPKELDQLRADMAKKTQIRMNGRLQPRFFQVMYDRGVLRMDDFGEPIVCNPFEYTKWNRANAMIESADFKESESLFKAYPEEREAWAKKVAEWTRGIKEIAGNMKLTNQE